MRRNINLNQLALPFGQARSRSIPYEDRLKAFWFLAGLCLFSLGAYIYAVNATARNVSMRAALERESAELTAELATLEFQYITLKGEVTLAVAAEYGFEEVRKPLYVSRDEKPSLSFNTETP